jgi:hypothetical protein
MLISLNVVNMAHVFCDAFSLDATVWRILDILTRDSDLVPPILLIFCVELLSTGLNGVTGILEIGTFNFGVDGTASTFGNEDGGGGGGGVAASTFGFTFSTTGVAAAAGALPPLVFIINTFEFAFIGPSDANNCSITPLTGETTSKVVLSVSILAITSSALTESPT